MFEIVEDRFRQHPNKEIKIPRRGTKNSAGFDFFTPIDLHIPAKSSSELIFTDICVKLENNQCLQLIPRSSIGIKKGIMLSNSVGLIDADFIDNPTTGGNIGFKFFNYSDKDVFIEEGSAIFQGIVLEYHTFKDEILPIKERIGGIGSTNEKTN